MTLNAGEVQSGGEVRDADGRLVVAIVASGGTNVISGGQVRDADGRLVVVID